MSDDRKAFTQVWNEKLQKFIFTDVTKGIGCVNHVGLDAGECLDLATTDCTDCKKSTRGETRSS